MMSFLKLEKKKKKKKIYQKKKLSTKIIYLFKNLIVTLQ